MDASNTLMQLYRDCLCEVIEHYANEAPHIEVLGDRPTARGFASILGFGDDSVKGTSVLKANHKDITVITPLGVDDPSDWLGELNNQVVGRMKNRLVRYGLLVHMSTPIATMGQGMEFTSHRGDVMRCACSWSTGVLNGLLSLTVEPGFQLAPEEATAVEVPEEGSLCLF